jgi:hypothetical protein
VAPGTTVTEVAGATGAAGVEGVGCCQTCWFL